VGMGWMGSFHTTPSLKMFNLLTVNCASQVVVSRYFLAQCAKNRQGKKCALVDYSSMGALGNNPPPKLIQYGATKAFNLWLSKGIAAEYAHTLKQNPGSEHNVDLDVLTVHPASVKTQMNSGRYPGTVTAAAHAKGVIDKLGWDSCTYGHWVHAARDFIMDYEPFKTINKMQWAARRRAFLKEKAAQEAEQAAAKKIEDDKAAE